MNVRTEIRSVSLIVVRQCTNLQYQEMGILPKDRRKGSHVSIIEKKEREYCYQQ